MKVLEQLRILGTEEYKTAETNSVYLSFSEELVTLGESRSTRFHLGAKLHVQYDVSAEAAKSIKLDLYSYMLEKAKHQIAEELYGEVREELIEILTEQDEYKKHEKTLNLLNELSV